MILDDENSWTRILASNIAIGSMYMLGQYSILCIRQEAKLPLIKKSTGLN